jgi:hypothetical protein
MKTDIIGKSSVCAAVFFLLVLLILSCQKDKFSFPDPSTLPKGLTGSWVETNTGTDTIIFNSDADSGFFSLSRGYGITNGYWLPVIGSSAYSYKISGDSISVVDGLSDSMEGGTYYFRFDEPNLKITIGKFSKYINGKGSVLTFRKIK